MVSAFVPSAICGKPSAFLRTGNAAISPRSRPRYHVISATAADDEFDVVVVGSGLGGLSAAAVASAAYRRSVCVLEAHTIPGGAAHSFTRRTEKGEFTFDSGPSLFSGLTGAKSSSNPLLFVLRAAGVELPVVRYPAWGCYFEDKHVVAPLSRSAPLFYDLMTAAGGPGALDETAALVTAMEPLARIVTAIPSAALRSGDVAGTARALLRYASPSMVKDIPYYLQLARPFGPMLRKHVRDPFAYNFMDLLCFLLAGVRADHIPTAEVAFMFSEWTGATAGEADTDYVLEFPVGGSGAIINALVEAMEKSNTGSELRLGTAVKRILTESDRAVGVELANGQRIRARRAVFSNASVWDTVNLLPPSSRRLASESRKMKKLDSFVHLHVALDMTDSDVDISSLQVNYVFVESWERAIDAPQNVVALAVPSIADPNLAPPGFVVFHAYTPATEPYSLYKDMKRGSQEYRDFKKQRCDCLWRALEKVVPDARKRAHIVMEGTPLTHERFLNLSEGTYGPEVSAQDGTFPGPDLAGINGLLCIGQTTFPGIGVPAVAASGIGAANSLVSVDEQLRLLERIGL